ncbi:thioredoxin TrxC [Sedimenticola hydrogenitrophicus]|uniref:thioredoxin TrxC n=1 Tax=Sedimenticola hydrogenitrophicus TaxID=2967975 RepID=UPI0023B17AD3|nr:thioredoxin TrxC [Sedimenticola hydrogenitrophicus]
MTHIVCPHCQGVNRVPERRLAEEPKCGKCRRPLFNATPIALNGAGFERFITRSELPLLVDFWAPWCGPCRMMAPAFEQAARRLEPRVQLIKLNTEEEQAVAARYGIRSIPTLILFRGGAEIARVSGAMDAAGLVAWTTKQL